MKKKIIRIQDHFDHASLLIAIVADASEHKLLWHINQQLAIPFRRITLEPPQRISMALLPYLYFFENSDGSAIYRFIPTTHIKNALPARLRKVDYFLTIQGGLSFYEQQRIVKNLKDIGSVIAAFEPGHVGDKMRKALV